MRKIKADYVFDFGKHKGKSLAWVYNNDKDYLKWVFNIEKILELPDSEFNMFRVKAREELVKNLECADEENFISARG